MNHKKAGWLFLFIIVIYIGASLAISYTSFGRNMSFLENNVLSEALVWVPALLMLILTGTNPLKHCRVHKMHISTGFMTILFSFLAMPAATLMNIISMFFVENQVSRMSTSMMGLGFFGCFFVVAIHAPFTEEFVFRGVLLNSYEKSASTCKAILLSALLFGLMHLNFNQFGYAFVLGIIMALLVEATGTIWSSVLLHVVVNGRSVVVLFLSDALSSLVPDDLAATLSETVITKSQLFMMLGWEMLLAVICLPIAACVLVWMAKKEGRLEHLKTLWAERKTGKVLSLPVILAIIICVGFMVRNVLY